MRVAISALVIPILGACGATSTPTPTPTAGPGAPAATPAPASDKVETGGASPGEIVTAEVQKMNSAAYGRPPNKFNAGHPTPHPAPKASSTATGFQVQFASHAAITTPTVYERAVIVSGGFNSRELYAFDRVTGSSLWALELHDDGPSSPACERGVCVVNTESCTIFAIAADTGKHLWSYWLGDPLTSAPTIAGNRVFASYPAGATSDGKPRPPGASHALAAFELRTGKILWQVWLDSDVMSAPVAMGDFVYVTTFRGTVIKLEQATGAIRYAMRAKATSAPVVQFDKSGVEQMYYTKRAEAADDADGAEEELIRADHNEPKTKYKTARKKAEYVDKKVQASSEYSANAKSADAGNGFGGGAPASSGASYAFDNVGVGSVSSMQGFQGSRIVKLRDKNVNTMGDEVLATDSDTGRKLWSYKLSGDIKKTGGFLGTAPLAAGNSILFATLSGEVLRLDQKTGKKVASYPVGGRVRSQPVVADGWIYVGTDDGRLVAINTKDKTITGWPTWGGNAQRTGIQR